MVSDQGELYQRASKKFVSGLSRRQTGQVCGAANLRQHPLVEQASIRTQELS
jgi:hypothetical protein